jgi:hypothetical protein
VRGLLAIANRSHARPAEECRIERLSPAEGGGQPAPANAGGLRVGEPDQALREPAGVRDRSRPLVASGADGKAPVSGGLWTGP